MDITGASGSSETMGNFVDTASDDGVFSSDSCDGDGISSLCCLEFGTEIGYPGIGVRAAWKSPIFCVVGYERIGVGDKGVGLAGGCICDWTGGGGCARDGTDTTGAELL